MCVSLLLKLRYSKMALVQRMVSIILYAGHAGKQVWYKYEQFHYKNLSIMHLDISTTAKVECLYVTSSDIRNH